MMRRPVLVLPFLLLAGCGQRVSAPSLASRAIEKMPVELPAPTGEAETPVDPALAQRIGALVAAAEEGDRKFAAVRAQVAPVIAAARGAAPGSEAWTVAQQALSTLDVARGAVQEAAAGVDALRQEPAAAGTGSRAALETASGRIQSIADGQAQMLAALQAQLR